MSKILKKIARLRKKYPEYAYMRYKVEANKKNNFSGDNWLKASLGIDCKDNKFYFVSTDRIHCSEDSGTAKTDADLIVELLNMFCNEKE